MYNNHAQNMSACKKGALWKKLIRIIWTNGVKYPKTKKWNDVTMLSIPLGMAIAW